MFRLPESRRRSPARAAGVPPPSDQGCACDAFPPSHAEGSFTPGCLMPRSSCLPAGPGSSQGQEHPSTTLLGGRSGPPPPSRKPSKAKGRRAGKQYTVLQGLCSKRNPREQDHGQRLWTCSECKLRAMANGTWSPPSYPKVPRKSDLSSPVENKFNATGSEHAQPVHLLCAVLQEAGPEACSVAHGSLRPPHPEERVRKSTSQALLLPEVLALPP